MVEMVVRDEHELDVGDRMPVQRQGLLESIVRLVVRRPGVDERERIAFQQPHVDGAEVRHAQLELGDSGQDGRAD